MTEEQRRTAHSLAELLKREPVMAREIKLHFDSDEQLFVLLNLDENTVNRDFFNRPRDEYLQEIRECVPLHTLIDYYRF